MIRDKLEEIQAKLTSNTLGNFLMSGELGDKYIVEAYRYVKQEHDSKLYTKMYGKGIHNKHSELFADSTSKTASRRGGHIETESRVIEFSYRPLLRLNRLGYTDIKAFLSNI